MHQQSAEVIYTLYGRKVQGKLQILIGSSLYEKFEHLRPPKKIKKKLHLKYSFSPIVVQNFDRRDRDMLVGEYGCASERNSSGRAERETGSD